MKASNPDNRPIQQRLALLAGLADLISDAYDPAALAYSVAELLGRALGVSRAGYGTVNLAEETISIERDWNAPGIKSLAGVLHFRVKRRSKLTPDRRPILTP